MIKSSVRLCCLMVRPPPRSPRTDTRFPYTTRFRARRGKRPQHYGCPMPRSAKPQEHLADAGADRNANPGPARPRALRHHSRFQTLPGTDMRPPPTFAALLLALTLPALPAAAQAAPLTTVPERSGFLPTGNVPTRAEPAPALPP